MTTVRVVAGTGTGPTETAAYDAALADCGLADYNLLRVSSVLPADATVERPDVAPALGPVGGVLTVVEARATLAGRGTAAAALGWATGTRGGLFYEAEATGEGATGRALTAVEEGLAAGAQLRTWSVGEPTVETATVVGEPDRHAAAVVVGAYGRAERVA